MIATPNAHVPFSTPGFTGSFYFNVDDVAALWADVKDRVEVAYPMEEFHYGMREFAIYDNNGYMLQFGSSMRPWECDLAMLGYGSGTPRSLQIFLARSSLISV